MDENENHLESALIYVLLFSAFGLFVLAIMSQRYERRQTDIENRFHGIQEMQRRAGGETPIAGEPDAGEPITRKPIDVERDHSIDVSSRVGDSSSNLLVQLRPLNIILGVVMLGAWSVLMWRRIGARADAKKADAKETDSAGGDGAGGNGDNTT